MAGVEQNQVVMVAKFGPGTGEHFGRQRGRFIQAIAAVIGDKVSALGFDLNRDGRIAGLEFVKGCAG